MRRLSIGLCFCLLCTVATQPVSAASAFDPFEEMLGDVESEEDYLELLDLLDAALKEPLNLLEADQAQLSRLPWVSPLVAQRIVEFRRQGRLGTIDDLEAVEGMDGRLVDLLRPFVAVEPPRRHPAPLRISTRLRVVSSPPTGDFDELKTYLRSEIGCGTYRAGLILEKDKHETDAGDFQAYYLEKQWRRARVTVGDFVLVSGHGLIFSNPYGHSPSTISPWRFSQGQFGIGPYTSVDENFAMRGTGVTIEGTGVGVCFAVSAADFDATLDEDGKVTSVNTSGYHTTERELEAKDKLRENLLAIAARFAREPLELKINLAYADFDRPFRAESGYGLSQEGNLAGSLDATLGIRETTLFVEAAASRYSDEGIVGGLAVDREALELLVLGRRYGRSYGSLHSRPFAYYSGSARGESGVLTRLTFKPVPNGLVAVASDLHKRYGGGDAASDPSGSESFLDFELKTGDFLITLGEKIAIAEEPTSSEGSPTEKRTRYRTRVDIRCAPSTSLWVRARYENLRSTERLRAADERFSSDLLRVDFGLRLGKILEVKGGAYTFAVDDYASRLYQYEAGLPYYPALQMLKTDGSRWYSIISCGKQPFGKLVTKFGRTSYADGSARSEWLFYYNLKVRH